jgi:hypothetical protein
MKVTEELRGLKEGEKTVEIVFGKYKRNLERLFSSGSYTEHSM